MSSLAQAVYAAGFGPVMVPVTVKGDPFHPPLEEKSMGKAPGVKPNGHWKAIGTPSAECTSEKEASLWDGWHANIGVACGRDPGTFAIDSDCDNHAVAVLIQQAIFAHLPEDAATRYVDCPNHYRFLIPVRITGEMPKGTTLRFAKGADSFGVDFLGEGKQFVAFGTHAGTGYPYAWTQDILSQIDGPWVFPEITLETLTRIKQDIVETLAQAGWVLTSGKTGTGGTSGTGEAPPVVAEEDLRAWLALTPNADTDSQFDSYDQFIQMAHAIWGASGGADWGRGVWNDWCDQRLQGSDEIADRVWESIKSSTLGLEWIRSRAREHAPTEAAQMSFDVVEPDPDTADDTIRPVWAALKARYVWISRQGVFYDLQTNIPFSPGTLDLELGHKKVALHAELMPTSKAKMTVQALLTSQPDLIRVEDLTYWPGRPVITHDDEGHPMLNTWRAPLFTRRKVTGKDVQIWLDHMEYVTGSKLAADILLKWFVLLVRYPEEKANWHPLLMTQPGVGKDSLLGPVLAAVGIQNNASVNATDLSRNWTDYLEHRLIYVSEARSQGGTEKSAHAVMNEIKEYLTRPPAMVRVERKGLTKYKVANSSMWVFFSNERVPLFIDRGDRRIWAIENFAANPKDKAYYERLHAWFRANPDAVANYLLDYALTTQDLDFFRGTAPDTDAKRALILANRDPVLTAVEEVIEEARHGMHFPVLVVDMTDFAKVVEAKLPKGRAPNSVVIAAKMKEAGAVPAAVGADGKAQPVRTDPAHVKRLWVLAPSDVQGRDYSTVRGSVAGKLYNDAKWPAPTQTRTGVPLGVVSNADVV